jgi:hypothetical protein
LPGPGGKTGFSGIKKESYFDVTL